MLSFAAGRAACLLAAFALLAARPALAQNERAKREARVLFQEANKLAARGEHARAIERFRAAYALFPSPKILVNMASTLRELGEDVEALSAYERYLAEEGPSLPADERAEVEKTLAELAARLGRVRFDVNEPGAVLLLDGMTVGASPIERDVWVKPGPHRAQARKEGFHPSSETSDVSAGGAHTFRLLLARAVMESRPAPAPGPPAAPAARTIAAPAPPVGPPAAVPALRRAAPPAPPLSHAGQFGVVARADLDQTLRGAAAAVGVTYGLLDVLDVGAAAVIGPIAGARASGQLFLLREAWKPYTTLGVPVFFVDGAHAGAHAGVGLQVDATRHVGAFVEAAVEYVPTLPSDYYTVFFLPSVGAQARW